MGEADPYKVWLEDFKREIDALAVNPPSGAAQAGRAAEAAFSSWWQSELQAGVCATVAPRPAEAAPTGGPSLAERFDSLARERAALGSELELLRQELAQRQRREEQARRGREQAEGELARLQAAREAADATAAEKIRLLEDRLQAHGQDRSFAQQACERLEARAQALEADLRQAEAQRTAADREVLEQRRRAERLEEELQRLRQEAAVAQATIAELRQQAPAFRERVIEFQEHTGSDVALLRQELREFLIKIKRLTDEAEGRQP